LKRPDAAHLAGYQESDPRTHGVHLIYAVGGQKYGSTTLAHALNLMRQKVSGRGIDIIIGLIQNNHRPAIDSKLVFAIVVAGCGALS